MHGKVGSHRRERRVPLWLCFFLALEAIELSNRWILPTEGVHHVGFGIVKRNKVKQEVHCNEKQQLDGLSTSFGGACLFFFGGASFGGPRSGGQPGGYPGSGDKPAWGLGA